MTQRTLAEIDFGPETETPRGWSYQLTLVFDDGARSTHDMHLSWVDYEYWSGGDKPPSLVAQRILEAAFAIEPTLQLGRTIDASTLRRRITDLDEAVISRL